MNPLASTQVDIWAPEAPILGPERANLAHCGRSAHTLKNIYPLLYGECCVFIDLVYLLKTFNLGPLFWSRPEDLQSWTPVLLGIPWGGGAFYIQMGGRLGWEA